MKDQVILRVLAKQMIPMILAFGLYVIAHGELGPGGGFQGGVILAAGFVLYGVVFGADELHRFLPRRVTDAGACLGVLVYAGAGIFGVVRGYRFLDYRAIVPSDWGAASAWGMTIVEWGVGLTVASVMVTVYNEIAQAHPPASPAREDA